METIEGNKLIARFMGAKKTGSATGLKEGGVAVEYSAKISDNITAVFYDKDGAWTDFQELQFHSSWDWLMPVVEKCGKITTEQPRPSINHCNKLDWIECEIGTFLRDCDIKNVWLKVTEFIILFNEKKEPNTNH